MCGIAGLVRYGADAERDIEIMKDRMLHRGPDMGGTWHSADKEVWLGHRRLSILDLSDTGTQPMISHDGRYVIVFNGEIYNHVHLKNLLAAAGICVFRGTSDTEILLEALEHLGISKTLQEAKGMFALALFDTTTGKLVMARDRVGEKPLYYGHVGEAFVFASDIGCIRALSHFNNPIHTQVLRGYFEHGYIPAPFTIYQGISKLIPGCVLEATYPYDEAHISVTPYWSMTETALRGKGHPFAGSFEEASRELERLITESIKEQMVADVPVGAFLSGGIDSATTVALMQSVSPGKVRSFTIGMEEQGYNEAVHAKAIAEHLGTEHTELYITASDAKSVIPLLAHTFSEPFADSSQIPTYLVSKMTREHVTVSLSGDGGDELFGGYNSYPHLLRIWNKIQNLPLAVRMAGRAFIRHTPLNWSERNQLRAGMIAATSPEELYRFMYSAKKLIEKIPLDPGMPDSQFYARELRGDALGSAEKDFMLQDLLMYHPDDILVKVDRTAMAVSLETRVPFLDRDVVEFAWSLPLAYLRKENVGKLVLRDVLYRHVPKEMMERPKKGFSIPISSWLKSSDLRSWAEELLAEKRIKEQGLLNPLTVKRIWNEYIHKGKWRNQIWYLLMFQAWYENEYKKSAAF